MLGPHKFVIDVFGEVYDLLTPWADEEFYDLGDCCDQLWKKHQANDKLDPWHSTILSDCRMYCYSVPDKDDQEDRDEEHNNAIGSMKGYISTFH